MSSDNTCIEQAEEKKRLQAKIAANPFAFLDDEDKGSDEEEEEEEEEAPREKRVAVEKKKKKKGKGGGGSSGGQSPQESLKRMGQPSPQEDAFDEGVRMPRHRCGVSAFVVCCARTRVLC